MNSDQKDNYWDKIPDEQTVDYTAPVGTADQDVPAQETPPEEDTQKTYEADQEVVNWSAAEYIHVEKGTLWYTIFTVIVLGLVSLDLLLLHTWTLSALVVVMAIAVVIYSRRPPTEIHYSISGKQGIYVGEQLYPFAHFKAFGIIRDGEHHFIKFIPIKRLSPGLSVYFPEEAGEAIVDILGPRLPMENLKLDIIDVVVRSIRL